MGLFAVCLYSNMSFMHMLCRDSVCGPLWSGWPPWARCCLFDFIFQHRSALLIIKPDYENILKSGHAMTNSNINKGDMTKRGSESALPMLRVNSIARMD